MVQSVLIFLYFLCYCCLHLTAGKVFKCAREGKSHPFHLIFLSPLLFLPSITRRELMSFPTPPEVERGGGVGCSTQKEASSGIRISGREGVITSRGTGISLFLSPFLNFLISPYYLVVFVYICIISRKVVLPVCSPDS